MLTKRAWAVVAVACVSMVAGDAVAKGKGAGKQVTGVVNLNTATAAQLDLLPGVGEKASKQIIEHRSKAPFTRPEELVKVKGFGKKSYEKLKPYLAVSGPTTIKVSPSGGTPASAQGRAAPPGR